MRDDAGFATFASLVLIASLVAVLPLLAAAGRLLEAQLARRTDAVLLRARARDAVAEAVSLMRADPSPGATSPHDPLFVHPPGGTTVASVEPRLTAVGHEGPDPRDHRPYPFINVNTVATRRLEDVAAARLPQDVSPARVLAGVHAARERGELLTPDTLRRAVGAGYEALHPVVTAEPLFNANTSSRRTLERLLRRHLGARRAHAVTTRITEYRSREEIDTGDLPRLLGVPADSAVPAVLGVRSHLVSLRVRRRGRHFEALLARLPGSARHPEIRVLRFAEVRP